MRLPIQDIDKVKKVLADKPVKRAFLFGSFSRDEGVEDSDVDILLELNYSEHIGLGFLRIKHELEEALNRKVDLVSEKALSKHILPFVNADKQLIYEAEQVIAIPTQDD